MQRSRIFTQRRSRQVVSHSTPSVFNGDRNPRFDALPRHAAFDGRGKELAEKVRFMTDIEWQNVSNEEKALFVRHTRQQLQTHPAEVSEQQRRRYYETTQHRVRLSANHITNPYQRMKSSLPFTMDTHGRKITVSEAMMETGDEERFEPHQAKTIEYAQIHFKQVFKDYIAKRKAGTSTESERRQIASMAESLHHVVQSHLANMYKYADCKLHDTVKQRAKSRLESLQATKENIQSFLRDKGATLRRPRTKVVRSESRYGIDQKTRKTITSRLRAQEEFLERLEILNQLTNSSTFVHTDKDEGLEQYADRLSMLLSLDAKEMSKMDAVRYFAKLESCEPIDWAQRWYEQNLLYPLEAVPEFTKLKAIVECGSEKSPKDVESATQQAAQKRFDSVIQFKKLLFSGAESPSLQQKRIKHLAFSFMQAQINRMRAKSLKYQNVDMEQERELVSAHLSAIQALGGDLSNAEVCRHHEQIQECVTQVMQRCRKRFADEATATGVETNDSKERIVRALEAKDPVALQEEVEKVKLRKKAETTLRLIRTLEEDVKADYKWYSLFEEAERPPQLPLPVPFHYVSASTSRALEGVGRSDEALKKNPFEKEKSSWNVTFLGTSVAIPTKQILFWGTGVKTVHQALAYAAEVARQRNAPIGTDDSSDGAVNSEEEEKNPWAWRTNPRGIDSLP